MKTPSAQDFSKCAAALAVAFCLGALAACSSANSTSANSSLTRITSAHAVLDASTGAIKLPLDKYAISKQDFLLVDKANNLVIAKCVHAAGQPMVPAHITATIGDDRRYGIWVSAFAQAYGYGSVPSAVITGYSSDSGKTTEASVKAYEACKVSSKDAQINVTLAGMSGNTSIVTTGTALASGLAHGDPLWDEARNEWFKCQRENGLKPRTGDNQWGPEVPKDEEGQIKVATVDVDCKNRVRLVQRLGDLEAGFQEGYIEKNQAALDNEKQKIDQAILKAKEIIAANGS